MEDNKSMTVKKTVKSGITFGSALAMVISLLSGHIGGANELAIDIAKTIVQRRKTCLAGGLEHDRTAGCQRRAHF